MSFLSCTEVLKASVVAQGLMNDDRDPWSFQSHWEIKTYVRKQRKKDYDVIPRSSSSAGGCSKPGTGAPVLLPRVCRGVSSWIKSRLQLFNVLHFLSYLATSGGSPALSVTDPPVCSRELFFSLLPSPLPFLPRSSDCPLCCSDIMPVSFQAFLKRQEWIPILSPHAYSSHIVGVQCIGVCVCGCTHLCVRNQRLMLGVVLCYSPT